MSIMSTSLSSVASSGVTSSVPQVAVDAAPISISSLTPDEKRCLLFDVNGTLEVPIEEFDDNWWPLISNVWTQCDSHKFVNGDVHKTFACRFAKHQTSSTRQDENIPIKHRRITKTRPFGLCNAKIKVTWFVASKMVQIERYKNSPDHTHSLLECDRIKRSKAIKSLVEQEAVKNYSPPAITAAMK